MIRRIDISLDMPEEKISGSIRCLVIFYRVTLAAWTQISKLNLRAKRPVQVGKQLLSNVYLSICRTTGLLILVHRFTAANCTKSVFVNIELLSQDCESNLKTSTPSPNSASSSPQTTMTKVKITAGTLSPCVNRKPIS